MADVLQKKYQRLIIQLGVPIILSIVLVLVVLSINTYVAYQKDRSQTLRIPEEVAVQVSRDIQAAFENLESDLRFISHIVADSRISTSSSHILQENCKKFTINL